MAAFSARRMIASITGWKPRWPSITASSMVASDSSLASDSTISTASCVPATTRSRADSFSSSTVGLSLSCRPICADAGGADRAHEGDARERQRGGGRDHRQDVGVVLEVVRQHGHDHLRVVAVALGEQRADRPVDQAGDQRLLLGRASLALEIAAGDAAGREGLFLIVDGERKEVLAGLRRLEADHGGEHGGLAVGGEHGAVGLAGDLAGLQDERAPGPIDDFAVNCEHR